jgi:hypothetical protein
MTNFAATLRKDANAISAPILPGLVDGMTSSSLYSPSKIQPSSQLYVLESGANTQIGMRRCYVGASLGNREYATSVFGGENVILTFGQGTFNTCQHSTWIPVRPSSVGVYVLRIGADLPLARDSYQECLPASEFWTWTNPQIQLFTDESHARLTAQPDTSIVRPENELRRASRTLSAAVAKIFTGAKIAESKYLDPDDGWETPTITVHTGLDDVDERLAREDEFYSAVSKDPTLAAALRKIGVIFE